MENENLKVEQATTAENNIAEKADDSKASKEVKPTIVSERKIIRSWNIFWS
nr:hypothetical protein [Mycoplasmopsis bovis]